MAASTRVEVMTQSGRRRRPSGDEVESFGLFEEELED
jgi:hypothetical protein